MGHGHVTPNPDGSKARCGGPALCSKCAQELAQLGQKSRERHEREHLGKIADATKAEAQPLIPEVWEAQQAELSRLCQAVQAAEVENQRLRARVAELEAGQNNAYNERNRCVAVMAKMALGLGYPAGLRSTAIEGWDESWHGCVWIDFPGGQASWHYHASDAYLFDGLPPYAKEWDGHTTPEKYEMLGRYRKPETPHNAPSVAQEVPVVDSASGKRYRIAWRKRGTDRQPRYSEWGDSRRHTESLVAEYNALQPGIEHWLEESTP